MIDVPSSKDKPSHALKGSRIVSLPMPPFFSGGLQVLGRLRVMTLIMAVLLRGLTHIPNKFAYPAGSMGRLYVYLHGWLIFMVNVAKYTSPMDPMGIVYPPIKS